MGDFNTAHHARSIWPARNKTQNQWLCPNEREELERWIQAGWVDSFRHVHGDAEGHYTWWSNRKGVRERNVGWRVDYALVSEAAMPFLQDAQVHSEVLGSDHCPISLQFDESVFAGFLIDSSKASRPSRFTFLARNFRAILWEALDGGAKQFVRSGLSSHFS